MFGALSRVFEEDPFFRDPFVSHSQHMHRFFSEPFGRDSFLPIKEGGEGRPDSRIALRDNHRTMSCSFMPFGSFGGMATHFPLMPFASCGGMAMSFPFMPFGCFGGMDMDFRDPFAFMGRMMSNMTNSMMELQRNFDKMTVDPNAHSFSSSSMMTYSKKGDEPPKVFQASAQTRMAPGGIKETRRALRDSESGLEKVSIGHHLHDRAHVVQKSRNKRTGDEELNQEFVNLDEAEAQSFDDQWQKEILRFRPSGGRRTIDGPRHRGVSHGNREDPVRREKTYPRTPIEGHRRSSSSVENLNIKGSHVPLISSKK